jgi:hypothetical protein
MRLGIKTFPIMFIVAFIIGFFSTRLFEDSKISLILNYLNSFSTTFTLYTAIVFFSIFVPLLLFYFLGKRYDIFIDFKIATISLFLASLSGFFSGTYIAKLLGVNAYNPPFLYLYDQFFSFQFLLVFVAGFFGFRLYGTKELNPLLEKLRNRRLSASIGAFVRKNFLFCSKVFLSGLPLLFVIGFLSLYNLFSTQIDIAMYYALMFVLCFPILWLVFFNIGKLANGNLGKYFLTVASLFFAILVGYFSGLWLSATWGWLLIGAHFPLVSPIFSALLIEWASLQCMCIFLIGLFALWFGYRKNIGKASVSRKKKRISMLMIVSVILLIGLLFGLTVKTWYIESVDYVGKDSGAPSLDLDSNGNPHIAYTDRNYSENYSLRYASYTSSNWTIQEVDSGLIVDQSFALDSRGNPHICYTKYLDDYTQKEIKYASWTGVNWSIQVISHIVGDPNSNGYPSLVIDSNDSIHISYFDNSQYNGALKYATWTGYNWTTDTVDTGEHGMQSSLAIDSRGNPYICYLRWSYTDWNLKYAKHVNSEWTINTIAFNVSTSAPAFALDSNDNPHVCFISADSPHTLKYAYWTGSNWMIQQVASSAWNPSLVVDSAGKVQVSYDSHEMKYGIIGGAFGNIAVVDSQESIGTPFLVLDEVENPHIACKQSFHLEEDTYSYTVSYATLMSAVENQNALYSVVGLDFFALILFALVFTKRLRAKQDRSRRNSLTI